MRAHCNGTNRRGAELTVGAEGDRIDAPSRRPVLEWSTKLPVAPDAPDADDSLRITGGERAAVRAEGDGVDASVSGVGDRAAELPVVVRRAGHTKEILELPNPEQNKHDRNCNEK
jgi:hypothetical protein